MYQHIFNHPCFRILAGLVAFAVAVALAVFMAMCNRRTRVDREPLIEDDDDSANQNG